MGYQEDREKELEMKLKRTVKLIGAGIAIIILLYIILASFFTVDSGHRALLFTWGEVTSVKTEGLNFKIRIQTEAIKAQGGKEYVNLKAIEKWDGKLPTYTGGGPIPFLEIK